MSLKYPCIHSAVASKTVSHCTQPRSSLQHFITCNTGRPDYNVVSMNLCFWCSLIRRCVCVCVYETKWPKLQATKIKKKITWFIATWYRLHYTTYFYICDILPTLSTFFLTHFPLYQAWKSVCNYWGLEILWHCKLAIIVINTVILQDMRTIET